MLSPGKSRKTTFSAKLPTSVPGISFTASGRVWFRQDPSNHPVLPLRVATAATLAGVYEIAKKITEDFAPEAVFPAEQGTAISLADWQSLKDSPIKVKAILTLDLASQDRAKAERYAESRRAARLNEELTWDRMDFLRDVALADEDTARRWWLHCNLTGGTPDTSWKVFDEVVRPVIRIADEDDIVTRLARALLTMNDYIHEEPERLETLATLVEFALQRMSRPELAEMLAKFRQPTTSDANGSVPSGP